MRHIVAIPATPENFAPFGRVISMTGADDSGLQQTQGPNWIDRYTLQPLVEVTPSLGRTVGPDISNPVVAMERHSAAEEVILPAADPIVLTVAAPNADPFASAPDVHAFLVTPGTAVVMHPGTWHAACAGIAGPTPYYWLATCVGAETAPWTDIVGGPVLVTLKEAEMTGAP